jgi:putative drug exporter of the RND superfamily
VFRAVGYSRIDNGLPMLAFLFLVALGVDYTIFLMTRAREDSAARGTRHIGLVVPIGILVDTFVVRTLLVPALTVHVGRSIWWRPGGARRTAAS